MMDLSDLEAVAGEPIARTEFEAVFRGYENIAVRHSRGVVDSWYNAEANRGGGVDSLARILGLPMPAAASRSLHYGSKREGR